MTIRGEGSYGVVIIGAPKAGSTALFDYLAASGKFATASVKETRHLLSPRHPLSRGSDGHSQEPVVDTYLGLFGTDRSVPFLEATPDYYYDSAAFAGLTELHGRLDGLVCVCLVRDPVERLRSMFLFARDTIGAVPSQFSLDVYGRDLLEGRDAAWRRTPLVRDAMRLGRYGELLQPWVTALGDSLLVVPSEWATANPAALASEIGHRVGLTPLAWPKTMPRSNATVAPISRSLHRVLRLVARRWPAESRARRRLRTAYDGLTARVTRGRVSEEWDADTRRRLSDYYSSDLAALRPQIWRGVPFDQMPDWLTRAD